MTKKKKSSLSIKTAIQLAIYLDNRPGALARACEALAKAEIGIDSLATEGESFGSRGGDMLVRMIVDDPNKAVAALGEVGAVAVPADVLVIEGGSQPGMVANIAARLGQADINIESVYLSSTSSLDKCTVILRPSNVENAIRVLGDL